MRRQLLSAIAGTRDQCRPDLTLTYAVHNAFRRDAALLMSASYSEDVRDGASIRAGWQTFKRHMAMQRSAKDSVLWPALRARLAGRPRELELLESMEAENAEMDPLIRKIDAALSHDRRFRLREYAEDFSTSLLRHLDHEEAEAIPLLQSVLSQQEWRAYCDEQRRQVGYKGAPSFFPWLLDGAPDSTRSQILDLLSPPLRFLCRTVWQPRYERVPHWELASAA
ncbi:hemerythrin domain-containing protein [Streptomyces buecherae]|uniref:hemerythrin domain-containing protein n=1 Tax=Streptomyces buecherae TaxID=2763006 RepID=UPI0033FDE855